MSISSLSPVYISPKTFYSTPPSIITRNNNVPYVPYYLDSIRHVTNEYKNIVEKDRNLRQKLHRQVETLSENIYENQKNIKSVYFCDLEIELPLTEEEFWKCRKYHMLHQNHYSKDEKKGICKILRYQHYNAYTGSSSINIFPIKKAPEFLRPMLPDITVLESTFWDYPNMFIIVKAENTKGWDDQGGLISQTILLKNGIKPDFKIQKEKFKTWGDTKKCKIQSNKQCIKLKSILGNRYKNVNNNNNKEKVVKTILHKRTCILSPYDGFLGKQINNAIENSNLKTMVKLMKDVIELNDTKCNDKYEWGTLEKSLMPYEDGEKVIF